jgi:3-dehydroquinate synthase
MIKIKAKTALRNYDIYIKKGVLGVASEIIKKNFPYFSSSAVITNDTVYKIYENEIKKLCQETGKHFEIIILEDGEKYKNLDSAEKVYSRLIKSNFHRNDLVISFGGGVVGDTAGFIASTFHRGLNLVHIPTTIIAQVDSSIGGKVVVNFGGVKNIIGTFYQPHMIIMDPSLLESLDEDQFINGLGEIVKYGLVFDRNILKILEKIIESDSFKYSQALTSDDFVEIIRRCVRIKVEVVKKDEFDTGYRNLLNFGHTIGHSIERMTGFKSISHGKAVSMGMAAALEISTAMGFLPENEKQTIIKFFKKIKIPYKISGIETKTIIEGIKYDKKFTSDINKFVLLRGINRPLVYSGVKDDIIIESLHNCINN